VNNVGGVPQLSASPGRIDPTNSAWSASRKPLVGEFTYNGRKLFLIANHFNSKGGDDPLFGHAQPPVRSSEIQRHQQAVLVNGFVKNILAVDANASVVVLGDLNDFQFSDTLALLKDGNVLNDLIDTLPANEQYSYVFEGNSQVLDHTLVSNSLATYALPVLDVVHANAEFAVQTSDHDPDVVRLTIPKAGDVDGDGDIDRNDINAITAARNTNPNGPFDPRDANGDGRIDLNDVRFASTICTRTGCAVQ
jgi:predicted extracellular nuclease